MIERYNEDKEKSEAVFTAFVFLFFMAWLSAVFIVANHGELLC
jgi:hypothetical protein